MSANYISLLALMKLCILTNDYCCITLLIIIYGNNIIASYVAKRFMKLKHAHIGRKNFLSPLNSGINLQFMYVLLP